MRLSTRLYGRILVLLGAAMIGVGEWLWRRGAEWRFWLDDRAGTASPPFEGTGSNPSLKQRSGDKPNG